MTYIATFSLTGAKRITPNHLAQPCLNCTVWGTHWWRRCVDWRKPVGTEHKAPGHWKPPLSLLLGRTQPPFCSFWSPPAWSGHGVVSAHGPHPPGSRRGPATCRCTAPAYRPKPEEGEGWRSTATRGRNKQEEDCYLEVKFRAVLAHDVKYAVKRSGHNPRVLLIFVPNHGESFPWACLAICKNANIVSIDDWLHQPVGGKCWELLRNKVSHILVCCIVLPVYILKQIFLRGLCTEHLIKLKLSGPSLGFHSDRVIV